MFPAAQSTANDPLIWSILDDLTRVRGRYGLLPGTLTVLKALLSFLPKSQTVEDGPLLIWPSNAKLAERAFGMPERSLRRHLERLVSAGLLTRHRSSNGKRFALRRQGAVIEAFGFDLAPLFREANEIAQAAREATCEAEISQILRSQIFAALTHLREAGNPLAEETEMRSLLRRKLSVAALQDQLDRLADLATPRPNPQDMAVSNGHSGRHIQNTKKEFYESVYREQTDSSEDVPSESQSIRPSDLHHLEETLALSPSPIRNEADLVRFSEMMAPMIGIAPHLLSCAKKKMGELSAALSVLCLVQMSPKLRSPAAYLQTLAARAEHRLFSLSGLLKHAGRLTAVPERGLA